VFARVSRFEVPKETLAKDIAGVEATKKRIAAIPGSTGMYYLVDPDSGKTMTITLWESERAMRDSEAAASEIRGETSAAVSAKLVAVEHYDVVAKPWAPGSSS
jgi:heme-degrading monooxygenase HmoA